MSLTIRHRQIDAARPTGRSYTLKDGDGLFLFVAAHGTKSWHFRYSLAGNRSRISFGVYPHMSLQRARELKSRAHTLLANGIDPQIEQSRAASTRAGSKDDTLFANAVERWYTGKQAAGRATSTLDKIRTYLDKDILPELGHKRLPDITRADCTRVQERIEKRNALNVSKKVRGWLREIFSQSIARGLCEFNPASELKVIAKAAPQSKPYPHLLEPELPAFLKALDQSQSRPIALTAARMAIWTASRPGMVRAAEWAEINLRIGNPFRIYRPRNLRSICNWCNFCVWNNKTLAFGGRFDESRRLKICSENEQPYPMLHHLIDEHL